jgi:hypothetical protein
VVKVDNNDRVSREGLVGIEAADIVVEERIEDRATRFAAIVHSESPEVIGPVRSARSSDIDLMANLGSPVFVYSGANPGVSRQLRDAADAGEVVLVVDDGGELLFRDSDFRRPSNLFTEVEAVLEARGDEAGAATPVVAFDDLDLDEGEGIETFEEAVGAVDGEGLTVTGRDLVAFVWVEGIGYVRVQDGTVHATRDDEPIVVDNVVVLETEYRSSTFAPGSVDAVTVGEGRSVVLRDGVAVVGTWERADRGDGWTLLDAAGEEISLDPGRSWITLAPAGDHELGVSEEDVEAVTSSGLVEIPDDDDTTDTDDEEDDEDA